MFTTPSMTFKSAGKTYPCPLSLDKLQWSLLCKTRSKFYVYDFNKSQFINIDETTYLSFLKTTKSVELVYDYDTIPSAKRE